MAYLCRFFEDYFKDGVQIDVLVFNLENDNVNVFSDSYPAIEDIEKQFDLELNRTSILKLETEPQKSILAKRRNWHKVENTARGYDLFVSFMIVAMYRGRAPKNIYVCMFPPAGFHYPRRNLLRHIIFEAYNKMFYKSYDVFIPNSNFSKYWLERYWQKNTKNITIYPPVFTEGSISERYKEEEKCNIIISVGRFFVGSHSKKQLDTLLFFLEYEDELKDYEYHIVGAVSNEKEHLEYFRKIERLARKSERIFIHGNCPFNELISLYTKAKIFWHATGYGIDETIEPFKMEHFGITTVEAMSYGAVPVVIRKGGQPEIVDDGVDGYLWETEEECIKKTVLLMENENARKSMAAKAAKKAENFSVEEFYRKNKEILDSLQI